MPCATPFREQWHTHQQQQKTRCAVRSVPLESMCACVYVGLIAMPRRARCLMRRRSPHPQNTRARASLASEALVKSVPQCKTICLNANQTSIATQDSNAKNPHKHLIHVQVKQKYSRKDVGKCSFMLMTHTIYAPRQSCTRSLSDTDNFILWVFIPFVHWFSAKPTHNENVWHLSVWPNPGDDDAIPLS